MLYHQMIDIAAYIMSLDDKPIEPKAAKIVLTGTEDRLVGVGMSLEFRLRDLMPHLSSMLKRTSEVSEEMVEWFIQKLPLNRVVEVSMNLKKEVLSQIEELYYNCDTIDQFLKIKLNPRDMYPTLLNLDFYELAGLNVPGEQILDEEMEKESVYAVDVEAPDGYISWPNYIGILTRIIFLQFGSSVKKSVMDLFSARR
ncbi:MAG: hypothetical protein CVV27_07705 [Candidatus Melainabacteria bacterium HGW-Melainabacteria-1]|nr:MAG: hypothetical protein CVV27_07705 [Candidatus Melainabacteria bacterium HGW-Melainabacteria-1]